MDEAWSKGNKETKDGIDNGCRSLSGVFSGLQTPSKLWFASSLLDFSSKIIAADVIWSQMIDHKSFNYVIKSRKKPGKNWPQMSWATIFFDESPKNLGSICNFDNGLNWSWSLFSIYLLMGGNSSGKNVFQTYYQIFQRVNLVNFIFKISSIRSKV